MLAIGDWNGNSGDKIQMWRDHPIRSFVPCSTQSAYSISTFNITVVIVLLALKTSADVHLKSAAGWIDTKQCLQSHTHALAHALVTAEKLVHPPERRNSASLELDKLKINFSLRRRLSKLWLVTWCRINVCGSRCEHKLIACSIAWNRLNAGPLSL